MRRLGRGESGTTIVEIAVGLAVGAVLVAGILLLVEQSQKAYMHSSEVTDLQQNVRVAVDRVTRIVQSAGLNPRNKTWAGGSPNDPAFTAFREAGRNCLRLYADVDGDGSVATTAFDENVYFHWAGAAGDPLMETRGAAGGQIDAGTAWVAAALGSEELARNIVPNPGGVDMFQYFTGTNDSGGAPDTQLFPPAQSTTVCNSILPANRSRVSRVVITITGRATISGQTLTKTVTTEARARNVP
jgi:Tfp pilus assembly protein PilW